MSRRKLLWSILLACSAAAAQPPAANPAGADFETKAAKLDALFRAQAAAGGSYLLSYRVGDRIVTTGYGSLDCARTRAMAPDAVFGAGSISKHFTSAAIMALVQDGRLKLDDRLGEVFRGVPADKAKITVSQLLAHRSGIPNFIDRAGKPIPANQWTVAYDDEPLTKREMLRAAWIAPLAYPPGTDEAYSNYSYQLLAALVEARSGEPFETYLRRRVLTPLGMTDTASRIVDANRPVVEQCREGRAVGEPDTGAASPATGWRLTGAGSLITTLADLQRWNAGLESGKVFRPDIQQRFDAAYFGPSYRCRTRMTAVGGSNGLTRSLIIHLPGRKESVVMVSTHAEWRAPAEDKIMEVLCPA